MTREWRWERGLVVVLTVLALCAGALEGQQRAGRLYRMVQGGVEVGRETYRWNGTVLERSVTIPLLNLKLDSHEEFDSSGRFVRFSAEVFNASGDSARSRYVAEVVGDSLRISRGRDSLRARRMLALRPEGVIPAQTISVVAEAAERARGRDTTFRYLPMGGDSLVAVTVRHDRDTAVVTMAGIVAQLLPTGVIDLPVQRIRSEIWNGRDSLPELPGLRRPTVSYDAPPGASYTAEHVRVVIRPATGDTFGLAATLTLPLGGRRRFPVVVAMSGSGQQDRDESLWPIVPDYRPFREYAERLAREGIAMLRYDDRMAGASGGTLGGTTADYTDDVRQLVAWLRARPDIDPARVALLGHSEGGVMGPLLAADDPRIAAVVILAGPSKSGRAVVRDQFRRPIETAAGLSAEERARQLAAVEPQIEQWVASNPWTRWFADYDPLVSARRLHAPVLIQHGALDRQVSVGQADSLAAAIRAAGNRDVTVRIYPRLNHLFLPTDGDGSPSEYGALRQQTLPVEVLDDTATWLVTKLIRR